MKVLPLAITLASLTLVPGGPSSTRPAPSPAPQQFENLDYDGRFIFARIRYGAGGGGRRGGGDAWAHDYPRADHHLPRILSEITTADVEYNGSNVFDLDDPELLNFPIAYHSEPGWWSAT